MKLLSRITLAVPAGTAAIELLQGDLSALPKEHEADILVISAFPNDYTPLPGSLMYALHEKGLNVAELAANKSVDMVKNLGCWLSAPLSATQQQQFNIRHILCFEPGREAGTPDQVVGNIFRCINNFAFDDDNNVIAMQVLATGRQKMPVDKMLPAMLEAAIFWLESGIPLDCIKLVVHGDELVLKALAVFNEAKQQHDAPPLPPRAEAVAGKAIAPPAAAPQTVPDQQEAKEYDCFISYSHQQSEPVAALVKALKEKNPGWNIFYDRTSIPTGGLWIKVISDAIQRSKQVVCILTPGYRDSSVCWDEFQCAKAKEYRTKKPVIKTINFLKDEEMPLIMSIYSYIDCTEGDVEKLKEAASSLV
jgi:hypothetical protein